MDNIVHVYYIIHDQSVVSIIVVQSDDVRAFLLWTLTHFLERAVSPLPLTSLSRPHRVLVAVEMALPAYRVLPLLLFSSVVFALCASQCMRLF